MEKLKQLKQKFIDFLYKINDYYVDHLWFRIVFEILYLILFTLSLVYLSLYWLDVFNDSFCGENVICCILSYFTFYIVMFKIPNN